MQDFEKNLIYDKAVEHYGLDNQLWVLIEELGELLQAIGKTGRARAENPKLRDDNHLAEETADVMICLEQLVRSFDIDRLVKYMMDFKLRRLLNRLESDDSRC